MNDFTNEVRSRWGGTDAYNEYQAKTKGYTKEKQAIANDELMAIFAKFAEAKRRGFLPCCNESLSLVSKLQSHISENYYTCTDEILVGLGKMYIADERFKKNIDKYGEGTAEFVAEAIGIHIRG